MRTIIFLLLLLGALAFFSVNVRRLVSYLKVGKGEERTDNIPARLRNVFSIVFGQKKLLREPAAGWMHFFIFWGFVILLTASRVSLAPGVDFSSAIWAAF